MATPASSPWKKIIAIALAVILVFMSAIALSGWIALGRRGPLTTYDSDENHFKYASIGTEAVSGIPYWIWVVLPRLFPEKLPAAGGYTSLGLTWEEGNEMPVGLTKEKVGINRVGMNCAVCHVGTVRETPVSNPQFILGGPSTKFDLQRYNQFFYDCANDPRFTAGFIQPEIEYNHHLSFIEGQLYRQVIIPQTRKAILKHQQDNRWIGDRPPWGPGRADLNPLKLNLLGLPDDRSIGNSDIIAVWNQLAPKGRAYYSDGLNTSLTETNRSGALIAGSNLKEINIESISRIERYLEHLPAPTYPFSIDLDQAVRGESIFAQNCASCHAAGSPQAGSVISVKEVNTDPERLEHWTDTAVEGMNQIASRYPWDFNEFRKTQGYVAPILDGVWARAPFLHNGSVPSLTALLKSPSERPTVFYRGYDVYDQDNIGFISTGDEVQSIGFRFDTTTPGNSNEGHPYGIDLSPLQKESLIEYLKTL